MPQRTSPVGYEAKFGPGRRYDRSTPESRPSSGNVCLYEPRWHETFAFQEAGMANSLFRAENSLFGLKNSLLCRLGNLAKKPENPAA